MRFLLIFGLFAAVFSHAALAQESVKLRTGLHDDYARLVFQWPSKPQYSVSKDGNRVILRFSKAGTPDVNGIDLSGNVQKVETISGPSEPLQMAVTIPQGSRFRDFTVENKVIIDVYNSGEAKTVAAPKPAAPAPSSEAAKPAEEKPPVKVAEEPKKEDPAKPVVKEDFTVAKESVAPVPVQQVEEPAKIAAPVLPDHTITLTSTKSFGVASFIRSGYLWIITDSPELGVKPEIVGPQKEALGQFTEEKIEGGRAFYMPMPDNMHAYGEGGGVGWKIHLTGRASNEKPATLKRDNKAISWGLKLMRKQFKLTDPLAGDTVSVFTAVHSDQFAGPARNFIELEQLESVIGLAYAAKTDEVKADISADKISVARPETLAAFQMPAAADAASAVPETPAEEDHEDPAEAPAQGEDATAMPPIEDLQKLADLKPSGGNIYNFPRWEMGGIGALNNNMHLIMLDSAGKKEEDRVESMITMAKLNIANNRAPEALGLLRIAEQFVPELDGNSEFQALRGAASALAGKFDVAFSDYTDLTLQKYNDVPYWRAFTLAGLEDWKQAIESLPSSFDELKTYPAAIRTPLALVLAEIALRGGKVPVAENILAMIAPDKDKMPIQYKSGLDYLNGEAARQKGDAAKAEEYWKPLYAGKDYLYRAKAGLSLTKMELDKKRIKPAEAIDRLEGLRYAWRGDELEALINFRLGQMYLENKDYLKGLTVLRNAHELATVRDLSNDIDVYMKKAFGDVFTKDHLNALSPLQAISLYEEFKDLAPLGEIGDRYVEMLAERLVNADLLGRAAALLEYQVNNRLKGDKKAEIAIRLAAIRLLDGNPDGALRSLEIAQATLNGIEPAAGVKDESETVKKAGDAKTDDKEEKPEEKDATPEPSAPLTSDSEKQRQINLLKARALSMKKKPDEAMAILEKMRLDPDVNRLRTDIAWGAGKWEEAAIALNDLIISEQISPRLPLTEYQTTIVLNRAISLNLSGDRVALANLRDRYNAQMEKTEKGKLFEIVTRPRRPDMVGSREAIESMISELSLFQGFLDSYSGVDASKKKDAAATTPAAKAVEGGAADTKPMAPATSAPSAAAEEKAPVKEPVPADKEAATPEAKKE